MAERSLYDYKARMYDPELGWFLQTDPVGYADSPNLYAYVLNDPVNSIDPLGLQGDDIIVTGVRPPKPPPPTEPLVSSFWDIELAKFTPNLGRLQPHSEDRGATYIWRAKQKSKPKKPGQKPQPYDPAKNYCGGEGGIDLPNSIGGVSINDLCYQHDVCFDRSGVSIETCNQVFSSSIIDKLALYGIRFPPFPVGGLVTGMIGGALGYVIVTFGGDKYYVPKQ